MNSIVFGLCIGWLGAYIVLWFVWPDTMICIYKTRPWKSLADKLGTTELYLIPIAPAYIIWYLL